MKASASKRPSNPVTDRRASVERASPRPVARRASAPPLSRFARQLPGRTDETQADWDAVARRWQRQDLSALLKDLRTSNEAHRKVDGKPVFNKEQRRSAAMLTVLALDWQPQPHTGIDHQNLKNAVHLCALSLMSANSALSDYPPSTIAKSILHEARKMVADRRSSPPDAFNIVIAIDDRAKSDGIGSQNLRARLQACA